MNLTIRQRSNITHFIYYLVNGTLDFELLNNHLSIDYHSYLKVHPELFYKTSCVFINQEVRLNPSWPQVKRLAEFICKEIEPQKNKHSTKFEAWEIDCQADALDFGGSFKSFTRWLIESTIIEAIGYYNYIQDGASFVEQCFAIWVNVIEFKEGQVVNFGHSKSRVAEYIKSYYNPNYEADLEEWECELHME